MIERQWALDFAHEWIDAWNVGDLDRILAHYTEDFGLSSPFIRERLGLETGCLLGKQEIRRYWASSLASMPTLRFEFIDAFTGMNSISILYRNVTREKLVIEHFRFDRQRLVYEAEALHCNKV